MRINPFRDEDDGDALKSDTVKLPVQARGFYVGSGGDVRYMTVGGRTITKACTAGSYHPVEIQQIFSTGTTATKIVVGW